MARWSSPTEPAGAYKGLRFGELSDVPGAPNRLGAGLLLSPTGSSTWPLLLCMTCQLLAAALSLARAPLR